MRGEIILEQPRNPYDYEVINDVRRCEGIARVRDYIKEPEKLTDTQNLSWKTMVSLSRKLWANNAIVKGAIDMVNLYSIGNSFDFRSASNSTEDEINLYNTTINDWFKVCSIDGKSNFKDILHKISQSVSVDGDCFILLTKTSTGFPQLQFIRANRITSEKNGIIKQGQRYAGLNIFNGVISNPKTGREIAYLIDNERYISANDMIHISDVDFLSSQRGNPLFSNCVSDFQLLQDIDEAELMAQKILAQVALVQKSSGGLEDLGAAYNGVGAAGETILKDYGNGQIRIIKSDEDLVTINSSRPSPEYQEFSERLYRKILSGICPVELLGLIGGAGSVELRVALNRFDNICTDRRTLLIDNAVRMISFAISCFIEMGVLPHVPQWYKMSFSKCKKPSVDLGRDSNSTINEIKLGIKSISQTVEESGTYYDDFLRDRAESIFKAKKIAQEYSKDGVTISETEILNLN